jgi:hypothetical protein
MMNKLFVSSMPIVVGLAALFGSAGAYAQTVQSDRAAAAAPAQQPLTRQEVYDQLVQAEQDGSKARADSIYYGTYWGWEEPHAYHPPTKTQ